MTVWRDKKVSSEGQPVGKRLFPALGTITDAIVFGGGDGGWVVLRCLGNDGHHSPLLLDPFYNGFAHSRSV